MFLPQFLAGPAPWWVLRGQGIPASIDFDFAHGLYHQAGRSAGLAQNRLLTVSRASTKYAAYSSGLWVPFASGVLAVTDQGALIEEARTNDALWARDMTNAVWVAVNMTTALTATGIDGTATSASTLTATAGNATVLQTITLGSAADTYSFFVKRITGTGTLNITDDNGTGWTALDATNCISATGVGTAPNSSTWVRCSKTQTLANPVFGIQIVTNGDSIAVDFNQLEPGSFMTSPILTTTVAATRAADVVTVTKVPIFGTSYSLFVGFTPKSPAANANPQTMLEVSTGVTTQRSLLRRDSAAGAASYRGVGGTFTVSGFGTTNPTTPNKLIGSEIAGAQAASLNGGAVGTAAGAALPTTPTAIFIGSDSASANQADSYISRIAIWPTTKLSNGELVRLSK